MHFQSRTLSGNTRLTDLYQYNTEQYPYLLVSTATGNNSRFDILFAYPQESLELYDREISELDAGFLDALHSWWREENIEDISNDNDPPFTGGWFIYLSYELAAEIEPVLNLPTGAHDEPIAMAVRCPAALIYDHQHDQYIAIAESAYSHLLDSIEQDYTSAEQVPATDKITVETIDEADTKTYLQQFARIKQYIVDGDIFQANLSRPWNLQIEAGISDVSIFNKLAEANPGSFAVLAKLPETTVISSSPERLVSVHNGTVETRPIAGTRPRSDDDIKDSELADELMAHPKEKAEHIMLIDLERNDLGRICIPGSIKVNELMALETYQHVHHIVSNVKGELAEGISPADVIRAVFPGGTITGCPKVRCMEILAEMEQQARGAYTGSIGYINRNGNMDLNILIRTLIRKGKQVNFRAGGGIVADSDAEHELAETRAKAKGLLRAFGIDQ